MKKEHVLNVGSAQDSVLISKLSGRARIPPRQSDSRVCAQTPEVCCSGSTRLEVGLNEVRLDRSWDT